MEADEAEDAVGVRGACPVDADASVVADGCRHGRGDMGESGDGDGDEVSWPSLLEFHAAAFVRERRADETNPVELEAGLIEGVFLEVEADDTEAGAWKLTDEGGAAIAKAAEMLEAV